MLETRLIGRASTKPERDLYVATAVNLESTSLELQQPIGPFVAFVALDTRQLSGERMWQPVEKFEVPRIRLGRPQLGDDLAELASESSGAVSMLSARVMAIAPSTRWGPSRRRSARKSTTPRATPLSAFFQSGTEKW